MRIHFIGTGDAFCSGGSNQTCFYVTVEEYRFLIDCGATSLKALSEHQISTDDIDGIIISHFHGDHYGGLPYVLLEAHFIKARTTPLTIIGPPEVAERVTSIAEIAYPGVDISKFSYSIEFKEFSEQALTMGPLEVQSFPVIHAAEANPHGVRVQYKEKVLAFSGDSGWTENLYHIERDADLFICECNYFDTEMPSHLSYNKIKEVLPNFSCKEIILNHLGPEMLKNRSRCDLPTAHDGLIINI